MKVVGQVGPLYAEDLLLGTRVWRAASFSVHLSIWGGGESKRSFPYKVLMYAMNRYGTGWGLNQSFVTRIGGMC